MASTFSFNGLGSGLDFNSLTEAIISDRSRPITQLQQKSAALGSQSSALKQLNGLLLTLTSAAKTLTDRSLGTGRLVTSSASSITSASATDTAAFGTLNINTARLATRFIEATRSFSSATAPVLAGGATSATFQLQTGGAATGPTITVDATNNTLTGLRDSINAANADVTAAIVDVRGDGTELQLSLTSKTTGAANRVQLVETTATGTAANLNLSSLNNLGATPDYSLLNASATINGLTITRSTNTITDAVAGVTLNLQSVGSANINISQNKDALGANLNGFVQAYNAVQSFIGSQYTRDATGRPTGVLAGNPTLRTVQQQLRDAVGGSSLANGGVLNNLTQVGIGRDDSGKLTIDSTVLNAKLRDSFGDVQSLFSGLTGSQTGLGNSIHLAVSGLSDEVTGLIQTTINGNQASVKNINKSIADQTDRISMLRASLARQFAAADAAIGNLNGQNTALTNILTSLQSNKNN